MRKGHNEHTSHACSSVRPCMPRMLRARADTRGQEFAGSPVAYLQRTWTFQRSSPVRACWLLAHEHTLTHTSKASPCTFVCLERTHILVSSAVSVFVSVFVLSFRAGERECVRGALSKVGCFARQPAPHVMCKAHSEHVAHAHPRTLASLRMRTHASYTHSHIYEHAHEHAQIFEASHHGGPAQHRVSRGRDQANARARARFEMSSENRGNPGLLSLFILSSSHSPRLCLKAVLGVPAPSDSGSCLSIAHSSLSPSASY